MTLHALGRADHEDCEIQNLKNALGFGREVNVPQRVEQGHGEVAGLEISLFGENRDAAPLFCGIGVEEGRAVVDTSRRAERTRRDEQGFRERRLAGIDMGQNAERQAAHQFSTRWKANPPISPSR